MDHRLKVLTALALAFAAPAAFAYYASAAALPGFSGAAGAHTFVRGSSGAYVGGAWIGSTFLNVGGRAATIPLGMTVGSGAGQVVARSLLLGPGGLAVSAAVLAWTALAAWEWNEAEGRWDIPTGELLEPQYAWFGTPNNTMNTSPSALCPIIMQQVNTAAGRTRFANPAWVPESETFGTCRGTEYRTDMTVIGDNRSFSNVTRGNNPNYDPDSGTVRPVVEADADALAQAQPVPDAVLNEYPGALPVEAPQLEATRIPLGAPLPVTGTDPQQYKQPVADVRPFPTPSNPWQVDVLPKDVTGTDPEGQTGEEPIDGGSPGATPSEDPPVNCDKYPDTSGCAPLDTPSDASVISATEIPVTISPDAGWGPDNASCPASRSVTVQGHLIPIPFDLFCTYFAGLRYIIIAFAWLGAGFILLGARES